MNIEQCPCCGHEANIRSVPYDKNPSEDKWVYNCFTDKSIVACSSCGCYFTKENLSDNELNEFYSSLFRGTEVIPVNSSRMYEFYPRFFSQALFLKTHVNLFDDMRILEIGPNQVSALPAISLFCRPSYYYFEQHEYSVIKYFGGKRLGQYFSQEYIENQTKVDKFDLVLMSHSLEHINPSGLHDTIKSLYAVLKDDGHLFIEVPDQIKGDKMPPHTLFFTTEGLKALLEGEGFRITGVQSIDGREPAQHASILSKQDTGKLNRSSLSKLMLRIIFLFSRKLFFIRFLRPALLRLILKDKIRELGVPYSHISYLRIVAKKVVG